MPDIQDVLSSRGSRYGDLRDNAVRYGHIKDLAMSTQSPNLEHLSPSIRYCFDMLLLKVSRMMYKPDDYDGWLDVIGYGTLAIQALESDRKSGTVTTTPYES